MPYSPFSHMILPATAVEKKETTSDFEVTLAMAFESQIRLVDGIPAGRTAARVPVRDVHLNMFQC